MKPRSLHFKPSSRSEAFVIDVNQAALDFFLSPTPSKTYVPSFPSIKFFEHQSYEKKRSNNIFWHILHFVTCHQDFVDRKKLTTALESMRICRFFSLP